MAISRSEPYKNIVHTIDLDGKNISLNIKNYKMFIGPIMSRLTGTENENNTINTFTPILHAFLQGKTMNEIRILFPKEYQLISEQKKSMIYLHGKSCVIRPEDSNFFLDRLYDELKANKRLNNGLLNPNNDKLVIFGEKNEKKKSKFIKPYFSRTVKCPCIITLLKLNNNTGKMNEEVVACNRYIDFGQTLSRKNFFKIFNLDNPLLGNINKNYEKVLFYINPSIKNMQRITPTCSCGTTFENLEGLNNYEGKNPLFQHPTDVQCPACNKKFCTDCKLTHTGILCNGMIPTPEGNYDWTHQSCPGCNTIIDRYIGCPYIKCEAIISNGDIQSICGAQWCWICRCFRTREFGDYHHYCLINDEISKNDNPNYFPRWTSNPDWISNKSEWRTQIKIKVLNRDHVEGSDLVV